MVTYEQALNHCLNDGILDFSDKYVGCQRRYHNGYVEWRTCELFGPAKGVWSKWSREGYDLTDPTDGLCTDDGFYTLVKDSKP